MKNIALVFVLFAFFYACNNSSNEKNTSDEANLIQVQFEVKGMTCSGCENAIINNVNEIDGVDLVEASHEAGQTTVTYDKNKTNIEEITLAIQDKGYEVLSHEEVQ